MQKVINSLYAERKTGIMTISELRCSTPKKNVGFGINIYASKNARKLFNRFAKEFYENNGPHYTRAEIFPQGTLYPQSYGKLRSDLKKLLKDANGTIIFNKVKGEDKISISYKNSLDEIYSKTSFKGGNEVILAEDLKHPEIIGAFSIKSKQQLRIQTILARLSSLYNNNNLIKDEAKTHNPFHKAFDSHFIKNYYARFKAICPNFELPDYVKPPFFSPSSKLVKWN